MGKKKAQLFGDGDDDCDDISVNEEFARRYEHNKKREALQRYEELKKKGQIESDSQSESESESEWSHSDLMNPSKKKDIKFFENLLKIRNRDPSLYLKDVNLFNSDSDASEDEEEEEEEEKSDGNDKLKKKKKKKETMYLKDVIGKQLMETGPDFDEEEEEEEEEEEDGKKERTMGKSYNEEQEELKKAILDAVKDAEEGDDDEGGELFKVKERSNEVEKEELEDGGEEFRKKVLEFFGKEEDLDENSKFLRSFFEEKMWVGKSKKGKKGAIDYDLNELERDEEDIERQDQYELEYNFRHEEKAGDRVLGHSRIVEDSVRKKDNARKVQRQNKMERMKLEEMQRKEELKHLKNLKKEEIKEKMQRVVKIAGIKEDDHLQLDLDDLEDDFDPEEYDKMMKKVFDEKYYGAKDLDPAYDTDNDEDGDDTEKPDFDREDELLGLPKGWDVTESSNAFLAARERSLKRKTENGIEENDYEEHEEEGSDKGGHEEDDGGGEEDRGKGEDGSDDGKRKRKRKMSLVKRAREAMMEEYYKLDYEDTIGDLKTRFKYAKVDPERYGLHTEDILVLDDKDLNQYVSVKKLAPYRDGKWKVPKSRKREYKTKLIELYNGKYAEKQNNKKRRSKDKNDKSIGSSQGGKAEEEKSKGDTSNMSRKARRKSKFKISVDRQKAYGK